MKLEEPSLRNVIMPLAFSFPTQRFILYSTSNPQRLFDHRTTERRHKRSYGPCSLVLIVNTGKRKWIDIFLHVVSGEMRLLSPNIIRGPRRPSPLQTRDISRLDLHPNFRTDPIFWFGPSPEITPPSARANVASHNKSDFFERAPKDWAGSDVKISESWKNGVIWLNAHSKVSNIRQLISGPMHKRTFIQSS